MIRFSIPTALSIFAATSALAMTSVALAVPALQPSEVISTVSSPTATPTQTHSATPNPDGNGDSPLAEYPDFEFFPGVNNHDLPLGLTTHINAEGVYFSYVGECIGERVHVTVWSNTGQIMGGGGHSCESFRPGQIMASGATVWWNQNTLNAYCYAPAGATTAYRAEVYGMFTEWVPIPDSMKQCQGGNAPWGPLPPGEVAPVTPTLPVEPAPAPSATDSSSPSPSVSATP